MEQEPSFTDEDYPGKVTQFADPDACVVLSIFGFQAADSAALHAASAELAALLSGEGTPAAVEAGRFTETDEQKSCLVALYWANEEDYGTWWSRPDVSHWWESYPEQGPVGAWRETMVTSAGRHQYATGQTDPAGPAHFLSLRPSPHFGFPGAYRARMADSDHERFASPLAVMPQEMSVETRGRRLVVDVPDNVCFIREGQTWDNCSPEEREIFHNLMKPAIDDWTGELARNPAGTGCLSIRDCVEQDLEGNDIERRSEFAFLLSLGHIEAAARKNASHLKLMKAFTQMYTDAQFVPQMNIWVEVHIPQPGKLQAEYINCQPRTGFLRFFPAREIARRGA